MRNFLRSVLNDRTGNILDNRLVQLALLLALFVIGKSLVQPDSISKLLWILIPAALLGLIVHKNPKLGIVVLFATIFLLEWLHATFLILPRQLTWLTDVIILILLVRTFTLSVAKRKRVLRTPIDTVLLLFILIGLFSSIINFVSPITAVLGLRHALKYVLFFYILVNLDFEERFLRKVITAFLIIAFIQVPVIILERTLWTPQLMVSFGAGGAMNIYDFPTGTLPRGSTGIVSLFLISVIGILLGFAIYRKNNNKLLIFAAIAFLLVPLPLTMSRASLLFLPVVLLFLLITNLPKRFRLRLSLAVSTFAVFFATIYFGSSVVGYDLIGYLSSGEAIKRGNKRVTGMQIMLHHLQEKPYGYAFGFGPGTWSESYFGTFSGAVWREFVTTGQVGATSSNQIVRTGGEFGLLGLITYLLIIYKVYLMNRNFFRRTSSDYWKAISFGYNGIIFLFVMSTIYVDIFYAGATAFLFWSFAGTIYAIGRRRGLRV